MIGSKVFVIKERDEWSNFAEFIGAVVAKYADAMDFDSLPNPDLYLLKRNMLDCYKAYNKERQKKYILMLNMFGKHDNIYSYR